MKPSRRYSKDIPCDLYKVDFLFVIGGTVAEAMAELCDSFRVEGEDRARAMSMVDGASGDAAGRFLHVPNRRCAAVWLKEVPTTPADHGAIAHECLHLVAHTMAAIGVEWTTHGEEGNKWANDEAFCYLLEYCVTEFAKFAEGVKTLRDRRAKKKKKR